MKKATTKKTALKPTGSAAAKPAVVKKTVTKPAVVKKTSAKKAQPKAAQFGFHAAVGGGKSKLGGKTTFANAMQAMGNLMGDLELVDTKDSSEFLSDADKKNKLLNCIQNNDFDKFDMILGMFKSTDEESKESVDDLARQVRTTLNESLLHLAVVHYVEKQDDRYMKSLCKVHFPLYEEDQNGDIPVFALSLWATDDEFMHGLQILLDAGLDLNYSNSSGKDLIQFLAEFSISTQRVIFMQKHGMVPNSLSTVKLSINDNSDLTESQKDKILDLF